MNIKLAVKMMRRNTGINLFYFCSTFLTSAMVFVICNTLNNPILEELTLESTASVALNLWGQLFIPDHVTNSSLSTFSILMFMAMIYSLVLNYYMSQVFSNNYVKPITVMMLAGVSTSLATKIIVVAYLLISLPAIVLGVLVGQLALIPLLDKTIYGLYQFVDPPIGVIYEGTYVIFASMLFASLALFITTKASDLRLNSASELLHKRVGVKNLESKKKMKSILTLHYPILYILALLDAKFEILNMGLYSCLLCGVYACYGILNSTIPIYSSILKKNHPTYQNNIILSEYGDDLKKSFLSITLLMVSVIASVVLISEVKTSQMVCILSVITLGAIVVMLSVSIFSQLYMGINEKVESAYQECLLGIRRKEVINLNTKELLLLFLSILLLTGIFCIGIILPSIEKGTLQSQYGIFYMIMLLVPLIICMVSTIFVFNQRIRRRLWRS